MVSMLAPSRTQKQTRATGQIPRTQPIHIQLGYFGLTPGGSGCTGSFDEDALSAIDVLANSGTLTDAQWQAIINMANDPNAAVRQWFGATLYNQVSAEQLANLALGQTFPYSDEGVARIEALGVLLGAATLSTSVALNPHYAEVFCK